jgi:hypothetical protein
MNSNLQYRNILKEKDEFNNLIKHEKTLRESESNQKIRYQSIIFSKDCQINTDKTKAIKLNPIKIIAGMDSTNKWTRK